MQFAALTARCNAPAPDIRRQDPGEVTLSVVIFSATREGHTCRVAEHIADALHDRRVAVDLLDVRQLRKPIDWAAYQTAVVAASVHLGRHEPEMIAFVRRHRLELERLSAAFISVTLSQAGAQDAHAPIDKRRAAAADVQRMIDHFVTETGWQPAHVLPVAGALMYRRYNPLIRFVMKRIAGKAGVPTDSSRNYDFTDWPAVDRFVEGVLLPA
jgi:menaquinone-dependent protoporphyrinogen oxidase